MISTYLTIGTLNVNGVNALIKRHRMTEWIKENKTYLYALYKKFSSDMKTHTE